MQGCLGQTHGGCLVWRTGPVVQGEVWLVKWTGPVVQGEGWLV